MSANADYTGFNYKDFASWSKSSTGKPYKATADRQPQINKDRQSRATFDYTAFAAKTNNDKD